MLHKPLPALYRARIVPILNLFARALSIPHHGTMANRLPVTAPKIVPFLIHWRVSVIQFIDLQSLLPEDKSPAGFDSLKSYQYIVHYVY